MTFVAFDFLTIGIDLVELVFIIVCFFLVLLVLMQRPKQEGLGASFGTNVTDQVFGARTTNVLQRGTVWLGSLFFILSFALAIMIGIRNKSHTLVNVNAKAPEQEAPAAPVTPPVTTPVVPDPTPAPVPTPGEPAPAPAPAPGEPAPVVPTPPVAPPPVDGTAPKPADSPAPAPAETPAKPAEGGEKPPGQ